ncbi:MAG: hpnR [Chthonomonadaceae bacterium]|nr:hpnR [Chthonomonadaceae bacterium]
MKKAILPVDDNRGERSSGSAEPDDCSRGAHDSAERVLLISMPFGALERPAISLGLLQAHCQRLNVPCETRYLTFAFAERVGLGDYLWLCSDSVPYTTFAGDWLFTEALYGRRPYADAAYLDEVLRRTWQLQETDLARLQRMRNEVEPFLDHCLISIAWSDYTFVGFTSVFQQNIASLALAARLKQRYPHLTIAFGGANWEDVMGVALLEQFPFVDLAFSGEADESFPAVLEARREKRSVHGIRGVSANSRSRLAALAPAVRVPDLDSVPVPDYDAFFAQKNASPSVAGISSTLLVETARGCWWGERSHCTFCGLNGATMAFRSKTPERVVTEMKLLRKRYGVKTFSVVDDILDMRYFRSVLPELAAADLGIDFFWEVKANLTSSQVRQLRDAGVVLIQPGIESLNDHVLKLMRKGTTAFHNVELMKWCREFGVKPYWNFLYGFPGETAEDYAESGALIEAIWHLDPPTGYGPIRMDRFSPYHTDPAGFGMVNIRPMAPFTYLYPFERQKLMEIAYYFDFDYEDGRTDDAYARQTLETVREWIADGARGMLEMRDESDGTLYLLDTRRELASAPRQATLRGWKAAVYLACDRAQTISHLMQLPAVQSEDVPESEIRAFLDRCVQNQLMVHNGQNWLGVAVHVPARENSFLPLPLVGAAAGTQSAV